MNETVTVKEYHETVSNLLADQIMELFNNPNYYESDYLRGQATSLLIALDKINKLIKD